MWERGVMPKTIPHVGLLTVQSDPGVRHLTLTDRSLVSIQKQLPNLSLKASESHTSVGKRYEVFVLIVII